MAKEMVLLGRRISVLEALGGLWRREMDYWRREIGNYRREFIYWRREEGYWDMRWFFGGVSLVIRDASWFIGCTRSRFIDISMKYGELGA